MCVDGWDLNDAKVVCRQLGYLDAMSAPRGSRSEDRTAGIIWINNVDCTGREESLLKCKHSGWGKANCWHEKVASAVCFKPGTVV